MLAPIYELPSSANMQITNAGFLKCVILYYSVYNYKRNIFWDVNKSCVKCREILISGWMKGLWKLYSNIPQRTIYAELALVNRKKCLKI